MGMKFSSGLSTQRSTRMGIEEACQQASQGLDGKKAHVAAVFVTSAHMGPALEDLPGMVRKLTQAQHLIGCTAGGIIGGGREIEGEPGIAVLLGHLPDVTLVPFSIGQEELEEIESEDDWLEKIPVAQVSEPTFLLLAEPFTLEIPRVIAGLNETFAGRPVIGGMASGAMAPGENRLFLGSESIEDGAVGLALLGKLQVGTIVSQGCRPVGRPLVITQAKEHLIYKIGGKQASRVLGEILAALTPEEQARARAGIHVGRVIHEAKESFGRGDFLVRNLMGVDPESGAIAVSDLFRAGQTIQFHIRDADAAREDLMELLQEYREEHARRPSAGGLLFSCNGRGQRLFQTKDHDSGLIRDTVGDFPMAGFFCAGEIGPIGGTNFLHGFTDSIGLFAPEE